MSDNKRIAKNTIFLYVRMIIIMGVSLFTSRVILDKLGVDDYGLYNVVGGVVGMLMFINGTLASGTSRFITYELGRNDKERLSLTFRTSFFTHIALALILVVILETGGLWFVYNKLIIPPDRLEAAIVAYHISIATMVVSQAQVPYMSLIIAHEKMGIYAYVSIFEAVAKLAIVYLLTISTSDKLIFYAILIAIVQCISVLVYALYCRIQYNESKLSLTYDMSIFRSLMKFSGWNTIAFISESLKLQGYLVLINLFFQPVVVAAQTIGNQVAAAMMQFIYSFRKAVDPQIIKQYASQDYTGSKELTIQSTIFTFDLVLLLGLPSIFAMKAIMSLWLVEVPDYAVVFTQYIIAQRIISVLDASLYTPMLASARLQTNGKLAVIFGIGSFVVLYVIFKLGGDVMWLQYVGIIVICLYSFYIKPLILVKEVKGYQYKDFVPCFLTCLKVSALSIAISYMAYMYLGNEKIIPAIALFIISFLAVIISSYIFLEKSMREKVNILVLTKFGQYRNNKKK